MPKQTIDVLMPVFNGAGTLARALDSILSGSSLPRKIIVVDDGSTDDTPLILSSYQAKCSLLETIRLPRNRGLLNALNVGLVSSISEFIARLDADDEWLPNHIEALERCLEKRPSLRLISTRYIVKRTGKNEYPRLPSDIMGLIKDNFIAHSSVCFQRECVSNQGGYIHSLFEDYATWVAIVDEPTQYHCLDETTAIIHILPNSLSRINRRRSLQERFKHQLKAFLKFHAFLPVPAKIHYGLLLLACWMRSRL